MEAWGGPPSDRLRIDPIQNRRLHLFVAAQKKERRPSSPALQVDAIGGEDGRRRGPKAVLAGKICKAFEMRFDAINAVDDIFLFGIAGRGYAGEIKIQQHPLRVVNFEFFQYVKSLADGPALVDLRLHQSFDDRHQPGRQAKVRDDLFRACEYSTSIDLKTGCAVTERIEHQRAKGVYVLEWSRARVRALFRRAIPRRPAVYIGALIVNYVGELEVDKLYAAIFRDQYIGSRQVPQYNPTIMYIEQRFADGAHAITILVETIDGFVRAVLVLIVEVEVHGVAPKRLGIQSLLDQEQVVPGLEELDKAWNAFEALQPNQDIGFFSEGVSVSIFGTIHL